MFYWPGLDSLVGASFETIVLSDVTKLRDGLGKSRADGCTVGRIFEVPLRIRTVVDVRLPVSFGCWV